MPQNGTAVSDTFAVVSRTERAGVVVLAVSGEVDLSSAPQLGETISAAMEDRPAVLVVDLTEVEVLTSAGVAVLYGGHNRAGDTDFRIVASRAPVLRPLQILGLTDIMAVYPATDQALAQPAPGTRARHCPSSSTPRGASAPSAGR